MTIMRLMVRKRKKQVLALQGVFEQLYSTNSWANQWELYRIHHDWSKVVGTALAEISEPAFFRRDVLWVYVDNSVWIQQLQFLKPDLLRNIRKQLHRVKLADVRFQLRPPDEQVMKKLSVQVPEREVDQEKYKSMQQLVSGIGDEQCREALFNLWECHQKKGDQNP